MKNTFGNSITLTLYGESHGPSVGVVLDGLPAGIPVDKAAIAACLQRRRPSGSLSTARRERDAFTVESGVFNGYTTGTPLCIRIPNEDVRSADYEQRLYTPRPSHADYTAHCKYGGFEDYRGGGHFSGRITAGLVAAGGIILPALHRKGIGIGTHLCRCGGIADRPFSDYAADIARLNEGGLPVLQATAAQRITQRIAEAKSRGDSIGGVLESAVIGMPAGMGEPWFDTVEGLLAHALFSIPGIKGVEFGAGFDFGNMTGSCANDPFAMENGRVVTTTNHSGGINGGVTNGMPVLVRCAVRPTPSIGQEQCTVNMQQQTDTTICITGRHDPCIAHRAAVVVDSVIGFTLCDILIGHYGTQWLREEEI